MKIGKKVLISGILFMSCCGGIISSKLVNVQTDYSVSEKQNREILQLNRLATIPAVEESEIKIK